MQVYTQQYAFAVKKNSAWLQDINRAISVLLNDGRMSRLFLKYVPKNCPDVAPVDTIKPLTVADLLSLVILFCVATGVSFLGKLSYFLVVKKLRRGRVGVSSIPQGNDATLSEANAATDSDPSLPYTTVKSVEAAKGGYATVLKNFTCNSGDSSSERKKSADFGTFFALPPSPFPTPDVPFRSNPATPVFHTYVADDTHPG